MSRSMTVRPAVGRTAGRGRGRGRGTQPTASQPKSTAPNRMNMNPNEQLGNSQTGRTPGHGMDANEENPSATGQENRMERRDAYTVIAPNERKREKISSQARQGEAAYQKHKDQNRLKTVSYVGTAGGGEMSRSEVTPSKAAHQRLQQQPALSPHERARQARERARRDEEKVLDKKKTEQRQKAEKNTMRDSARQRMHEPDRRARNEAFLNRIEQESKQKQQQKVLTSTTAKREEPTEKDFRSSSPDYGRATGAEGYASSQQSSLDRLHNRYPHCDRDYLNGLLRTMNGDMDAIHDLLDG